MKRVLPLLLATAATLTCAHPLYPEVSSAFNPGNHTGDGLTYAGIVQGRIPQVQDICMNAPQSQIPILLSELCVDVLKASLNMLKGWEEEYHEAMQIEWHKKGIWTTDDKRSHELAQASVLWYKVVNVVTRAVTAHFEHKDEIPDPETNIKMLTFLQNDIITLGQVRRQRPEMEYSPNDDEAGKDKTVLDQGDILASEDPSRVENEEVEGPSEPEMVDHTSTIDGEEVHMYLPVCDQACQNATHFTSWFSMSTIAVHQACESGCYTTRCLNMTQNSLADLLGFNDYYNSHDPDSPDWQIHSTQRTAEELLMKIEKAVLMAQLEWATDNHASETGQMLIKIKDDLWQLRSQKHWPGQKVPSPPPDLSQQEGGRLTPESATPDPGQVKVIPTVPEQNTKMSTWSLVKMPLGLMSLLLLMAAVFQGIRASHVFEEKTDQRYELEQGMTERLREDDELLADASVWDRPWSELKLC
ncbi:hypothetical protein CLAFUR0_14508 [Fulvia fulva]|nr:hypothetical protein CLAFUR0_14508 [Fulvia fulva]